MSNLKALNERSLFLANTSKANDKAIADHCILIAEHIKEHGDVTPATILCDAFGKSSGLRVNAIRQWFLSYGGCSWNQEAKKFGKRKQGTFSFDRDAAVANQWYTLRPEPEFKAFDLEAFIKKAIAKANTALEDVEHANLHKVDKAMLNALVGLLDKGPHYVEQANADEQARKDATVETVTKAPDGWTEVEGGASANGGEIIPVQVPEAAVIAADAMASVKVRGRKASMTAH